MKILSWGMGTQSTALGAMSALGAFGLPKLDYIIAADPGWERRATYDIVRWYKPWFEEHGIPVSIIKTGDIRHDGAKAHVHIPFFTQDGGPLRRQCTREFKIHPLKREIRRLLGYDERKPPHPPTNAAESWMGISLDEWQRMTTSRVLFIRNRYPLIEQKLTRQDCINWLTEQGLPVPGKSSCVGCPYRSDPEWAEMRDNDPDEWQDAVAFDAENRHNPLAEYGSHASALYLHKSLIPIDSVEFRQSSNGSKAVQIPMFIPCEGGYCHV